jgi:hypothetical protein
MPSPIARLMICVSHLMSWRCNPGTLREYRIEKIENLPAPDNRVTGNEDEQHAFRDVQGSWFVIHGQDLSPERSLKSSVCICMGLPSDLIIRLGSARRRWLTTKNRPYHEPPALLLTLLETVADLTSNPSRNQDDMRSDAALEGANCGSERICRMSRGYPGWKT